MKAKNSVSLTPKAQALIKDLHEFYGTTELHFADQVNAEHRVNSDTKLFEGLDMLVQNHKAVIDTLKLFKKLEKHERQLFQPIKDCHIFQCAKGIVKLSEHHEEVYNLFAKISGVYKGKVYHKWDGNVSLKYLDDILKITSDADNLALLLKDLNSVGTNYEFYGCSYTGKLENTLLNVNKTQNLIKDKQHFLEAVKFFKSYSKDFAKDPKDAFTYSEEFIQFDKNNSPKDKKYLLAQKDKVPTRWWDLVNKGFIRWSAPDVLYQISQKGGGFSSEQAAQEIAQHNSIDTILYNWLEGDFAENKLITGYLVSVWETLKEMGLSLDKSTTGDEKYTQIGGCVCLPAYSSKRLEEIAPKVIARLQKAHKDADISKTIKRFEASRIHYANWLAD
jgi:hypothetical protein